jgi:hypothetical protein
MHYISKTLPMLENLTGFYKQADGQTKRKIPKMVQGFKNKKEAEFNLLFTFAPQASRCFGRTGDPRINPEDSGLL